MFPRPAIIAMALLSLGSAPLLAQNDTTAIAGKTPAECLKAANDWRMQQARQQQQAGKQIDYTAILTRSRQLASQCATRLDPDHLPAAQLPSLADLYMFAADSARAHATVERALAAPGLSPREHAQALVMGIRDALNRADIFKGIVAPAEELAHQLDALPDSLADVKIAGHQYLEGLYGYGDVDAGVRRHAQAIIDINRRTGAGQQAMTSAYDDVARTYGDYLHPDSALVVLDSALRKLPPSDRMRSMLENSRARYALVGKPAAAIHGDHWINAAGFPDTISFPDGKVWLVQFTAHWCVPCRNSYPGIKAMAQHFAGTDFRGLMVTDLYGTFEGKSATPEEELADDQTYYVEHHALPFPVAVNNAVPRAPAGANRPPDLNQRYEVGGIPQIIIIDRKGIIRQIVVGWDQGNQERLTRLVQELLQERRG